MNKKIKTTIKRYTTFIFSLIWNILMSLIIIKIIDDNSNIIIVKITGLISAILIYIISIIAITITGENIVKSKLDNDYNKIK
jgi:hypothetical protein